MDALFLFEGDQFNFQKKFFTTKTARKTEKDRVFAVAEKS